MSRRGRLRPVPWRQRWSRIRNRRRHRSPRSRRRRPPPDFRPLRAALAGASGSTIDAFQASVPAPVQKRSAYFSVRFRVEVVLSFGVLRGPRPAPRRPTARLSPSSATAARSRSSESARGMTSASVARSEGALRRLSGRGSVPDPAGAHLLRTGHAACRVIAREPLLRAGRSSRGPGNRTSGVERSIASPNACPRRARAALPRLARETTGAIDARPVAPKRVLCAGATARGRIVRARRVRRSAGRVGRLDPPIRVAEEPPVALVRGVASVLADDHRRVARAARHGRRVRATRQASALVAIGRRGVGAGCVARSRRCSAVIRARRSVRDARARSAVGLRGPAGDEQDERQERERRRSKGSSQNRHASLVSIPSR
jgi:hypothetical protein